MNRKTLTMILKGMCNVIFFSSVIFILVLISESNVFHQVLAQMSEMNDDQVVLKTLDAGSFIGQRKHLSENVKPSDPNELPRTYFSFRGIPYGQPPTGTELRWLEPQPVEPRRHPKIATDYTPVCSQWDPAKRRVIGTQDCLYLNVFTPYVPIAVRRPLVENMTSWTVENRNLLPVLVYIHGGEYLSGSGNFYGPERFMKENVVLVTFSYRIGILGFLSNGDTSLPGNYGLLDQIQALRWVQQNIYRFGGNPLRVTVFGNVEYLLLSPRARGLFHAGIVTPSSTSLLGPFKSTKGPKELTLAVAKAAGCPLEIKEEMIECLKITDVDRLIRIQHKLLKFFNYPSQGIGPVVDKDWQEFSVLPDDPENILEEGRFANVPLMVGVSAYEGFNLFFEFYVKLGKNRDDVLKDQGFIKERLQATLKVILGVQDVGDDSEFTRIFESIWRYYFGGIESNDWDKEPHRVLWKLFRVFGDLTMHSGHRRFLQLISSQDKAPVFNYVFNHSIEQLSNYIEQRLKLLGNKERDVDRTLHSSGIPPWKELYYLFEPLDFDNSTFSKKNSTEQVHGPIYSMRNFTQEDEKISNFLVKLWVSFANYGSPKQVISKMGSHGRWQRASENSLNYYVIGKDSYAMKMDFRKSESLFWLSILPQIRELSEKITELEPFPLLFWIFVGLTSALIVITLLLMILICCSKAREKQGTEYGEDNVVFLNRIPTH